MIPCVKLFIARLKHTLMKGHCYYAVTICDENIMTFFCTYLHAHGEITSELVDI